MKNNQDGAEGLKRIAEREIEKNPHSRELIAAFLPLMVVRERFLGRDKSGNSDSVACDGVRFLVGVPLIAQQKLYRRDDPWDEMALAVVSAMKEGFPGLRDDLDRFEVAICDGRISLYDGLQDNLGRGEKVIRDWAADIRVDPRRIGFVLSQVKGMALQMRRKDVGGVLKGADWRKGYCPVCGAFPSIAWIQEKGGQRWLHCSQCGQDWSFSRVICPYCESQGEDGMTFFHVENNDRESVFACDQCKRYLITLNHVADFLDRDPDLSAIALAHLDLIMQEKGFLPMTVSGWNVFQTEELDHLEEGCR